MTEVEQIAELRAALETLVSLHKDWDKGTAYVPVKFMRDNNAAIAAARDILRRTDAMPTDAATVAAVPAGVCAAQPMVVVEVVGNGAVFARVSVRKFCESIGLSYQCSLVAELDAKAGKTMSDPGARREPDHG